MLHLIINLFLKGFLWLLVLDLHNDRLNSASQLMNSSIHLAHGKGIISEKFLLVVLFTQLSLTKSWPVEYLTISCQSADKGMISHHGCPELLPGSLGARWVHASLCQILIDWTGSAILGPFVKAVKFIGIQQEGRQSGDRAYFVVLIESRSPSLQATLDRREALGESITITCPLVILFHSTSPNLTACYELFTTLSVQYTQPPLTDCS